MDEVRPTKTTELEHAGHNARNIQAAILSIVPGLGHIAKGYTSWGMAFMFLAVPVLWLSIIFGAASLGVGLVLAPVYWFAVMLHAFGLPDLRRPAVRQRRTFR